MYNVAQKGSARAIKETRMEKILTSYVDAGDLERIAADAGVPVDELKATGGKYGGMPRYLGKRTLITVAVLGLMVVAAGAAGAVYWQRKKRAETKKN